MQLAKLALPTLFLFAAGCQHAESRPDPSQRVEKPESGCPCGKCPHKGQASESDEHKTCPHCEPQGEHHHRSGEGPAGEHHGEASACPHAAHAGGAHADDAGPDAAHPQTGHHGAHDRSHFADPAKFVGSWNAAERDAWQKPEEILSAMALQEGATVVDLGAGTGYLIPKLSGAVGPSGTVIAADIEPAMVTFLTSAAKEQAWENVRPQLSSADDPNLAPRSVDAIVALNVWHHVENRVAYGRKLAAALKPGGTFVIVDFLPEPTEGFGPPLRMRLSATRMQTELEEAGFAVSLVEESLPRQYIVRGTLP